VAITVLEKNDGADFGSGPPAMIPHQTPALNGGRVVLYSRNRHGNYPLAGYALHLGLRGDDTRVSNDVNLLFGNIARKGQFAGRWIDEVPSALGPGHGAAGMSDGVKNSDLKLIDSSDDETLADNPSAEIQIRLHDTFQMNCRGAQANRIIDLGAIDFKTARANAQDFVKAQSRIIVQANHVYAIRLRETGDERLQTPLYYKLKVLQHRDNDAVMFDWEPQQPGSVEKDTDF
jgi:hypothetical protein